MIKGKVLIRTQRLENEDEFDWVFDFKPPFGPYPLELKETFPFNAEVIAEPDYESLTIALQNLIELMKLNNDCEFTLALDGLSGHQLMKEFQVAGQINAASKIKYCK